MSLSDRISAVSESLTDVEQSILTAIVAAAGDSAFLSAAAIASRCSVHETTVIRLARKLGYSGYRELRADVRTSGQRSNASLVSRARPRDKNHLLADYLRDEAEALMRLVDLIPQEQLSSIADLIIGARRVHILGISNLVDCLAKRLWRVGVDARPVLGSDREMAQRLIGIGPQDVVFGFAIRPDLSVARLMPFFDQKGAKVIVASDIAGINLPSAPEHLLTVLRGADEDFRTLVVPIALCYAIELVIYHQHPDQATKSLAEMDDITEVLASRHRPPKRTRRT